MRKLPRALLIMSVGIAAMLFLMALRAVAIAGPAGATLVDSSTTTKFADMAIRILVPVFTLFAMWAANRVIRAIEKKWGIDIPERQEALVETWIGQGILLAEEKSRSKVKEKLDRLRGPAKLEIALQYVLGMINSQGWDTWAKNKLASKIEAKLGAHRANGGKPSFDFEAHPDMPMPE